jgi:hypothetical protein
MPYIPRAQRDSAEPNTADPGELTYLLYRLCLDALPPEPRYRDFHAVLGALEATKLEFYRRHVATYEDGKIAENGDVGR